MSVLDSNSVLVLNAHWVVTNVKSGADAFVDLCGGAYAALDITDEYMTPVSWEQWLTLPIRPGDDAVRTPSRTIRMPRVIIALNYKKVPVRRKRCNTRSLYDHHKGICAVTRKKISRAEASSDHVVPKSKGGKDGWDNEVLCHRDVNSRRGNRSYEEAGLKPPDRLPPPKPLPFAATVVNSKGYPEWDRILKN